MALPHDSRGGARDSCEREVVRQAVVVRLLRLPEEEARIEHRVVRLGRVEDDQINTGKKTHRYDADERNGSTSTNTNTNLHDDLQAVLREDARRELGAAVRLALVSAVRREECRGGRVPCRMRVMNMEARCPSLGLTVGGLERVRDEVRLVRVVERRDRELELVRDLAHIMSRRTIPQGELQDVP